MLYEIINKRGLRASFEYICFGQLQCIDTWYKKDINIYLNDEDEEDEESFNITRIRDEWGTHKYIEGFSPSDLKTLVYKIGSSHIKKDSLDNFLQIMTHPIFNGVEFKEEKGYLNFHFDMESSRMDETMFKAFLVRNYFESKARRDSCKWLLKEGIPLDVAFFVVQNYYVYKGLYHYSLYEDFEDGSILYDYGNPVGDLVYLILGDKPNFSDDYWKDTISGYSDPGFRTTPEAVWRSNQELRWNEKNKLNKVNGIYPKSINTLTCFRKEEDYPDYLQSSLSDMLDFSCEPKENLINFAREIHERTEKERSHRTAENQD